MRHDPEPGHAPRTSPRACAELRERGPFPPAIAEGLAARDPDQMRAAVSHLMRAGRIENLRPLVERFRAKSDFGVWARVTSSMLHRAAGEFAAGAADIDDLMPRFPARAGAHWWVAKARCLEGLEPRRRGGGGGPRRRRALPRCRAAARLARQPAVAPERAGRSAGGLARRHRPLRRARLSWFVGLSNALKAVGRRERGAGRVGGRRPAFSGDRRTPPMLARNRRGARRNGRARWRSGTNSPTLRRPDDPQAVVGRARALFRLDRIDEACRAAREHRGA